MWCHNGPGFACTAIVDVKITVKVTTTVCTHSIGQSVKFFIPSLQINSS